MDLDIRQWSPTTGQEPVIRVGLILAADRCATVRITPGAERCAVEPAEGIGWTTDDDATLTFASQRGRLVVRRGNAMLPLGSHATVRPITAGALRAGAGICVHDVPAGRGFHWETQRDVRVPGAVEVYADGDVVVVVNVVPLEDYLSGVITAEMSGSCPGALLEAQCIVARSWLLAMTEAKHQNEPFHRCNDDCCQRYQGTDGISAAALAAVDATRGLVLLTPTRDVLDANYAKSCGGVSERARFVWGADKPGISAVVDAPAGSGADRFLPVTEANLAEYLDGAWAGAAGVFCSPAVVPIDVLGEYLGRVDRVDDYFRWHAVLPFATLREHWQRQAGPLAEVARLHDLRVLGRGVSGRVAQLEVVGADSHGRACQVQLPNEYAIRAALHPRFLYSSAFVTELERDAAGAVQTVGLRGAGWGHGVGLCQIGALGMALRGYDAQAICTHYYPQATLEHVYR